MHEEIDPAESAPGIYDWVKDGEISAPDAPLGLLSATVDAEWTGTSWQLSVDGIDDDALRVLLGSAIAGALVERRDGKEET